MRAGPSLFPLAGEGPGPSAGSRRQLGCVLGISLLVGLPAALMMASYQAATLDEAGDIFGDSEFVVLEPEKGVGKRFPLLNSIDIGRELAEGEWIVVLYYHDCPSCREAILKYEELSRDLAACSDGPRVALVELPPYGPCVDRPASNKSPSTFGRLDDVKEWFVATPTVLFLGSGVVTKVFGPERAGTNAAYSGTSVSANPAPGGASPVGRAADVVQRRAVQGKVLSRLSVVCFLYRGFFRKERLR